MNSCIFYATVFGIQCALQFEHFQILWNWYTNFAFCVKKKVKSKIKMNLNWYLLTNTKQSKSRFRYFFVSFCSDPDIRYSYSWPLIPLPKSISRSLDGICKSIKQYILQCFMYERKIKNVKFLRQGRIIAFFYKKKRSASTMFGDPYFSVNLMKTRAHYCLTTKNRTSSSICYIFFIVYVVVI